MDTTDPNDPDYQEGEGGNRTPVVENVTAAQIEGTKLMEIFYDLKVSDNRDCVVTVKWSTDNGNSFLLQQQHWSVLLALAWFLATVSRSPGTWAWTGTTSLPSPVALRSLQAESQPIITQLALPQLVELLKPASNLPLDQPTLCCMTLPERPCRLRNISTPSPPFTWPATAGISIVMPSNTG